MVNISEYIQNIRFEIKSILFDWGNTVMKVFPGHLGPMATWTEVAAIEDIPNILPQLKELYQLVLISNAQDSNRASVLQALERVHLAQYFDEIFTPHELKERKPAPRFYLNVLRHIGIEPENGVMIGDDYQNDIIAAKQVGLWTIWYNANHQQLQNNSYPYHDAEVINLRDIVSIIQEKLKFHY